MPRCTGASRRKLDFQALFEKRYADEPFVDVHAGGQPSGHALGARGQRLPHRGAPAAGARERGDTLVVLSVIDNLMKGASGQAVQNMNLMFGLPETTGLEQLAVVP